MQIIFASGMATGRFAMSSNECFSQNTALGKEEGLSGARAEPINLESTDVETSKHTNQETGSVDERGKGGVANLKRKMTCEDDYIVMLA